MWFMFFNLGLELIFGLRVSKEGRSFDNLFGEKKTLESPVLICSEEDG